MLNFPKFASIVVFISIFSLTACGKKIKEEQKDEFEFSSINELPSLKGYELEDLECQQQGAGVSEFDSGKIFTLRSGESTSNYKYLSNINSSTSLRGNHISGTDFGMVTEQECQIDGDSHSCGNMLSVRQEAAPLKICRPNADFRRNTIEGIALTSVVHVDSLFNYYYSIPTEKLSLRKVKLLILPSFIKQYPSDTRMKRDNLAFYPNLNGEPTIAVFPKGDTGKTLWGDANLWESPWILAHEASHHVFRSHVDLNRLTKDSHDSSRHALHLSKKLGNKEVKRLGLTSSSLRKVSGLDVSSIVNEAFADLFAHLSLQGESRWLNNLKCFAQSRDPNSDMFADRDTEKSITSDVISKFFSASSIRGGDCDTPNFQDSHMVGAIVANGLYKLFKLSAEYKNQYSAKDDKKNNIDAAATSLKWLHSINNKMNAIEGTPASLRRLIELGVSAATVDGESLTSEQCSVVRKNFPAFSRQWIDSDNPTFRCL